MPPPQTPQHAQQPQHGQAYTAASTGGSNNNNAFLHTVLNTNSTSPARRGVTSAPTQFSATQRSAQARGKEYNNVGRSEESYESRQKREEAGRILESVEMLIWWSSARNEVSLTHKNPFHRHILSLCYTLLSILARGCRGDAIADREVKCVLVYSANPSSLPKRRLGHRGI